MPTPFLPDEATPRPGSTHRNPAQRGDLRYPPQAWRDSSTVRSYEAGRDGGARPGEVLRYLENLATRASAGLGFDNRWYRQHGVAWVVREMALLLGARAAIDDGLRLSTWVSDFRRVQATRDYLITHATSGRLVARAQARWAYLDRETGRPARIADEIAARMGPWGYGMRVRRPAGSSEGLTATASYALTARAYEADTQGHINNCVYLDWFHEAALGALASGAPNIAASLRGVTHGAHPRARFFWLEYIRPAVPGDALTIQSAPVLSRSRGMGLWQWITPASGGEPIARAWSEWLADASPLTPAPGSTSYV